ncbi:MAG: ABC transporter permease [Rhodospirillaceae bacterium]|jgi:branched-chain amino acid transport system permease protein|nr:ABC transporter permease [Rhodospirillaceae bacterium]MBT5242833.1 ABC transporter permease [Rhodospirillaceae bacterium]MBT5564034.1 ABC transporter permease [Rhodospirillaceae bacterium]MBT6243309.1 ABC transporter permease [Rhodospirillaceae bacterium]MBT7137143.1 ABC transporter permease [Rhodospirillaceae bacterium]
MGFYVVQFLTGLSSASALFLVASGLSIIFGVTRVVNFAHGSLYMLGAFIGYSLVGVLSGMFGYWISILLAAVIVGLIAVLIEILILRRVYQAPELFQLVATFGPILIIQDVALSIWGPEDLFSVSAPGLDGAIMIMGTAMPEYDLALIALSFLVLGGLWLLFNRTRWGTLVRAATEDRDMVSALGVNQTWLFTATFFLGSFLAALGGAAQLPKGGASLIMDFEILAPIFVVVVIGGMGSILGAFLAALLISELNAFAILVWPESTLGLMFVVMAIVLIARPWGLFGKPEAAGQHGQVGPPDQPYRPLSRKSLLAFAGVLGLLLLLPVLVSEFSLVLVMDMVILSLFAASIHYLMGPGGLVSFGHAAFFGGGAYSVALLHEHFDTPMEIAFIMGPIGAGILALAIGWFCVRRSGVYLAMLTLAFAQVAWSISFQWGDVTGGDDGIIGVWPSSWASSKVAYYYLTLLFGIGGIIVLRRTLFTPFGYAMRACRDSRLRSASIGINITRQQWLSFAFSGAMAGLAGALFVYLKGSIFPDEMSLARSFDGLIMVLLGGVKTLTGPIAGATAFTWLDDVISRLDYWRFILGSLIILIVLAFPQGISGYFRERFGSWFGQGEADQ